MEGNVRQGQEALHGHCGEGQKAIREGDGAIQRREIHAKLISLSNNQRVRPLFSRLKEKKN